MARPHPTQNVSFQESLPPSRRAPSRSDTPPRPPNKGYNSKNSLEPVTTNTSDAKYALNYDEGFVDAGTSNPQGFSSSNGADVRRKKSMVRPERERIDPGHRLWHYREHAAQDEMNVMPSCKCFVALQDAQNLTTRSHWKPTVQSAKRWRQPATWKIIAGQRNRRGRSAIWLEHLQTQCHFAKESLSCHTQATTKRSSIKPGWCRWTSEGRRREAGMFGKFRPGTKGRLDGILFHHHLLDSRLHLEKRIRQAYTRGAESMEGEDRYRVNLRHPYGSGRFPHFRFHPNGLW